MVEPTSDPSPGPSPKGASLAWPALLFFVSGFAGLTYEVLWQRELGLLFGNTTQATATTLAVFFLGLAAGSWWIGGRAVVWRDPLRAFARLEIGVGLSAALVVVLLPLYRSLFAPLYDVLGGQSPALLLAKFLLAAIVLGLPAFLMGGTLPVLAELATRRGRGFARGGVLLYAVNTAGAMAGAFAAGFVLPRVLGYRGAYGVAMALSLAVGLVAAWLARREPAGASVAPSQAPVTSVPAGLLALATLSGFGALALEVLWTRMVALGFQNSVYTFAAVITVFLGALALGAAIARVIRRRGLPTRNVLCVLLLLSGIAAAASPYVFRWLVDRPGAVGRGEPWAAYVLSNLGVLAACILPASILLGTVFPFLLRMEEERGGAAAASARFGRLLACNTGGALLGAVAAGFVLPAAVGLWGALAVVSMLYLVAAAVLAPPAARPGVAAAMLAVVIAGLVTSDSARTWNVRGSDRVLAVYEGGSGTVFVVDRRGDLKLKLNNSYTLGGTSEPRWEHYQAHIPLCLHPNPKRAFFLGMGSGITAGAALHHPLKRVRVAEIVPQAVRAVREHFGPWINGLMHDRRVEIVVEDGRTILLGSRETYDVVVGDLFLPWRRGTALLYTVEQFEAVKARLAPGGLFAQWVPLYQMGEAEFLGIARGFLKVFPNATLWRGDFFSKRPIVALVGHASDAPWDGDATVRQWQRLEKAGAIEEGASVETLPFLFYAGRLALAADRLAKHPLVTDDRPWIEWRSPVAQLDRAAGEARPFYLRALAEFEQSLLRVEDDPFLQGLSRKRRGYVEAGMHLYDIATAPTVGGDEIRAKALPGWIRKVPSRMRPDIERWVR